MPDRVRAPRERERERDREMRRGPAPRRVKLSSTLFELWRVQRDAIIGQNVWTSSCLQGSWFLFTCVKIAQAAAAVVDTAREHAATGTNMLSPNLYEKSSCVYITYRRTLLIAFCTALKNPPLASKRTLARETHREGTRVLSGSHLSVRQRVRQLLEFREIDTCDGWSRFTVTAKKSALVTSF